MTGRFYRDDKLVQTQGYCVVHNDVPQEQLSILPLRIMTDEILPASLGHRHALSSLLLRRDTSELIRRTLSLAIDVSLNIFLRTLNIAGHIKGITGCLGNGEAVVQSDATGNGTETNEDSPHLVDGLGAVAGAVGGLGGVDERALEAQSDEEHDKGGTELAETLHGKDSTHHGSTPLGRRELGGDDTG